MTTKDKNTEAKQSTAAQQRVDAFTRELALVLRRITDRTPERGSDQRLPNPVPEPPRVAQENDDEKR